MRIYIFLILIFVLGCRKQAANPHFFQQLKQLEYSRNADLNTWTRLYQEHPKESERLQIVAAMGKTRIERFVPFYTRLIKNSPSEALVNSALFALGEVNSAEAGRALLSLPYDSLSGTSKSCYLLALGRSCPQSAPSFLKNLLDRGDPPPAIWKALAFCSRKKTGRATMRGILADSSFYKNFDTEKAYFAFYAAERTNLANLLPLLHDGKGLSQKYLLKTLSRLYKKQPDGFRSILVNDSTLQKNFSAHLLSFLNRPLGWQNTLYALRLAPLAGDSLMLQPVLRLTSAANIHLQLEAYKALTLLNDSVATQTILSRFSRFKNFYLKGNSLVLLAKIQPQKAFRLIVQELGKGDVYYKGTLLDALGNISNGLAITTLKQYLHVADSYLNMKAFDVLDARHKIRLSDAEAMLHSSSLPNVYTALGWYSRHHRKLPRTTILDLFVRFNKIGDFELQKELIDVFNTEKFSPDSLETQQFIAHAGHPAVLKHLRRLWPNAFQRAVETPDYISYLPSFLHPDSISVPSTAPAVIINTSRGEIKITLFYDAAPLTCKNFLTLAQRHFYDNLSFHRVIADFVVQGGDPSGTGFGGPGYMIPSEDNPRPFKRGSLGMATAGFDTGGSQFFICLSEQPHLTGNYTLFGQVDQGMDIVDQLVPGDKILSVRVIREP